LRWVNCKAMNGLGRSPRPVPKRSRDSVAPGGFVFKGRIVGYVTLGVNTEDEDIDKQGW